jgi:hypothetical protein
MNKSDLIHEIFLFDKEIADYGIKKRVLLTNNYVLDKGMLYRKYGSEELATVSMIDESKEKELLAFYEVFFSELDSNNSYKDGNTYAEKVLNFIKRTKAYDKFELIRDQQSNSNDEYNSIDSHFWKSYNNKFLGQNKTYSELEKKKNIFNSIENTFGWLFFISLIIFIFISIPIFIVSVITKDSPSSFIMTANISSFIVGVIAFGITTYVEKTVSIYQDKLDKMKYKTGTFKDIDKKEFFEDIENFYKDDLFYKELKKQYNITNTQSGNQIIGE